jgi:hypothetical protein
MVVSWASKQAADAVALVISLLLRPAIEAAKGVAKHTVLDVFEPKKA